MVFLGDQLIGEVEEENGCNRAWLAYEKQDETVLTYEDVDYKSILLGVQRNFRDTTPGQAVEDHYFVDMYRLHPFLKE